MTITAFEYERIVFDSVMDAIHDEGEVVKEIFIPSLKLVFNQKGHCYPAEGPQNKEHSHFRGTKIEHPLTEIELPPQFVEKISSFAKQRLELLEKEKDLKSDLTKILDQIR